jgi:hypothetical protein
MHAMPESSPLILASSADPKDLQTGCSIVVVDDDGCVLRCPPCMVAPFFSWHALLV